MSENLLKALMQLFAIVARPDSSEESRRPLVEDFLKQQLNQELYEAYLNVFDDFYETHRKKSKTKKAKKYISASSVKVLTICTMINKELNLKQRIIVLIRLLEFINEGGETTQQEIEFVNTVADTFNVNREEYKNLKHFAFNKFERIEEENILIVDKNTKPATPTAKHLSTYSLDAPIYVYQSVATNMHIFVYRGEAEMTLNGQLIHKNRIYVLSSGSAIRNSQRYPLYYSDIVSAFKRDGDKVDLRLDVDNISYQFQNGVYGVQQMCFAEESGKLVGIMGASGSGKSTLLNVLNGNLQPTTGAVHINGFDVHQEQTAIEGIIGYVSQDDLLIEDLTVFQNLYFNAKLCFGQHKRFQLFRLVAETLKNLGLYEIKHMKVGNPLNKKISGGQRKRLNIALELIRKPEVLFLDEPTSGLSSADSENIMDLLKELSLQGKLIFLVIHQPSSEIFKMFDRLILLDQGGYVIYDGDPVDSIVYFKSKIKQADWNAGECSVCGTVNPEQLFSIIESRVLDEYGNQSSVRKKKPHEWYELYKAIPKKLPSGTPISLKLPKISFNTPNRLKQLLVFTQRDVLAKLANTQYLMLNLLEAPLLGFLLAYIIKYYSVAGNAEAEYMLSKNENLPVYIFMSVIVAVFIGLTMSADEIIKDRMILKRESFLHLSRASYLLSKIYILLMIAAYQAFAFVMIGNLVLEIKSMYWEYWLTLFSTWAFALMLGLNISDGFKTSVTIYIIIPFLIIPQIVLSGVIVKYDKLNPSISSPEEIPWYGEIITTRWAYEALAVEQYTSNKYMKPLYKYERIKYQANYKKDIWLKELRSQLSFIETHKDTDERTEEVKESLLLLKNEIAAEQAKNNIGEEELNPENFKPETFDNELIETTRAYFDKLQRLYIEAFRKADNERNQYILAQTQTPEAADSFTTVKKQHTNESLEDFVTNRNEVRDFVLYNNRIHQNKGLIYLYPEKFLKAHFYAPRKKIVSQYYKTFYVNVVFIWFTTLLLFISLYYRWLYKFLESFKTISIKAETIRQKLKHKK